MLDFAPRKTLSTRPAARSAARLAAPLALALATALLATPFAATAADAPHPQNVSTAAPAPPAAPAEATPAVPAGHADDKTKQWSVIEKYCFDCHNTTDWAGGIAFD